MNEIEAIEKIFSALEANDEFTIRKGGNCMVLELVTANVSATKKTKLNEMGFKFNYMTEKDADHLLAAFTF